MRRSICYCEPNVVLAGEVSNWKFIYKTATPLNKGARLKFDLLSKGRNIDWEVPSSDLKGTKNVIYAQLDDGKVLQAREIETPDSYVPQFEFTLPCALKMGESFTVVMGGPPKARVGKTNPGNTAQTHVQRRRQFLLYIDPKGNGGYEEPETFTMDIRGNVIHAVRILCPSFVARNKRFDITIRFEDEFGNLTNNAPENTLIDLSYEHLRENLNWKLFIPETGFVTLPNLYFNEPGVYKIRLQNMQSREVWISPPIKCFPDNDKHLFWGLLHGESERIDSTENIEACLRHFRDDKALNFFASSCFESAEETSNELWKTLSQNIAELNEESRFSTFLGFQWPGDPRQEGIRHIIFQKDTKPLLRKKDIKVNTLKKMYKSFTPKDFLSIPCFTMGKGFSYNFEDYNPDFERVVEIYNAWGSSECTAKQGNPRPICADNKTGIQEDPEGSLQKALQNNCRFGFVAGGLDDRGCYAEFYEGDQEQYSPGLTGIVCHHHTREGLLEALYARSCYATTGERIIVGLNLAGYPMGSEASTAEKPGLAVNRHLSGYVAGTADLKSVEIIRNGKVLTSLKVKGDHLDFTFDDMTPLEDVVLNPSDKKPPFVYYYLRVVQSDGHMAWSSPIWVDYVIVKSTRPAAVPKKKPKGK